MDTFEHIIVAIIGISLVLLGIVQWRKTRRIQKAYRDLLDEERVELDKIAHQSPLISAYAKPLNKAAWITIVIAFGLLIMMLIF